MSKSLTIRRPDDLHVHLRQDELLGLCCYYSSMVFGRNLVMPNTDPPILTAEDAWHYKSQIINAGFSGSEPLMTIKLTDATTPDTVIKAHRWGVVAAKLYPVGVTTNSADGVTNINGLWPVFAAMQEVGMVLCLHGEHPKTSVFEREAAFLPMLGQIADAFPNLLIVLEHISTSVAADFVAGLAESGASVAATITVHHLMMTVDDLMGGELKPHLFCKPVVKRPADKAALLMAATSGNPCFFFGSDSAPHPRRKKQSDSCSAGVFCAPVAMQALAGVFEGMGSLDKLEDFTSRFGAEFYGLPLNEGFIRLYKEPWKVESPYVYGNTGKVVPFLAGQTLDWQVSPEPGS